VGDEDINGIVLSGGAALISGFAHLMSERLGIPVEVADVLKKSTNPKGWQSMKSHRLQLSQSVLQ